MMTTMMVKRSAVAICHHVKMLFIVIGLFGLRCGHDIHCFCLQKKKKFSQGHSVSSARGECEAKTSQTQELHQPQSAIT